MSKKEIILTLIRKNLSVREKIISYIFKDYTFKIYRIGYKDGFNLRRKK